MTERPAARRNAYGPPAGVVIKRNTKAKPIPAAAVEPEPIRYPVSVPAPEPAQQRPAQDPLGLTQQDAVDLVFSLTEAIEGANANVQRWAHKGDAPRMDAALIQAKRFETLRERIAAAIPKLTRKG